ncbi:hypothetical protein DFH07DRAFT_782797 [Mycena maculata]|uniref:Nitroreductase domain-containing protein n=1 Tax=Mycena maculata TaxID=230809 RepID=A0AAD7HR54_9AGAR|nr:hypothetical protein DFH07DRAFT_782797 [Mycena maculata]
MSDAYLAAIAVRRTNLHLEAIVKTCVLHGPTPFNMQSSRAVLVTGAAHKKVWELVTEAIEKDLEGEAKEGALNRVAGFSAGYGSVLFFEDQKVIDDVHQTVPRVEHQGHRDAAAHGVDGALARGPRREPAAQRRLLRRARPEYSEGLLPSLDLTAIMPFGDPAAPLSEKSFGPIEDRVKVFKAY